MKSRAKYRYVEVASIRLDDGVDSARAVRRFEKVLAVVAAFEKAGRVVRAVPARYDYNTLSIQTRKAS